MKERSGGKEAKRGQRHIWRAQGKGGGSREEGVEGGKSLKRKKMAGRVGGKGGVSPKVMSQEKENWFFPEEKATPKQPEHFRTNDLPPGQGHLADKRKQGNPCGKNEGKGITHNGKKKKRTWFMS